jgi:hypothetical protein
MIVIARIMATAQNVVMIEKERVSAIQAISRRI